MNDEKNNRLLNGVQLVHALPADDLADAMSIFTVPVVLGGGKKLFSDGSAPHAFTLTRSRVSITGVMIGQNERAGEIEVDKAALDIPSGAEEALQARPSREG